MGHKDRERKARIQQGLEPSHVQHLQRAALLDRLDQLEAGSLRSETRQAARKSYFCECRHGNGFCGRPIRPGDQYLRLNLIDEKANNWKGQYISLKICLQCDHHSAQEQEE